MDNVNSLPVDGNVYEEIQGIFISESDCNNETFEGTSDTNGEISESDSANSSESKNIPLDVYHSSMFSVNTSSQDDQIKSYLNWPAMDSTPVDEFNTHGYIPRAFPTLFPYGKASLRSHRLKTIKPANYFKHLMNYHDGRFAKHPTYRYFTYNSICLLYTSELPTNREV